MKRGAGAAMSKCVTHAALYNAPAKRDNPRPRQGVSFPLLSKEGVRGR